MKNVWILVVAFSLIALVAGVTLAQNGQDLFQKALVKERAEGNLEEAIAIYKQAVKGAGADRALAARAISDRATTKIKTHFMTEPPCRFPT